MYNNPSFLHYLQNPQLSSVEEQWKLLPVAPILETVFALELVQQYLVGCTSRGRILVWDIPQLPRMEEDEEETMAGDTYNGDPVAIFHLDLGLGTTNCLNDLYAMEYLETAQGKQLLMVAGDGGVYLLNWKQQILTQLKRSTKDSSASSTLQPFQTYRLHPHPQQTTECNDLCVSSSDHLFAAAGDAFGCYKWNLATSQLVTTYAPKKQQRSSYLHTVSNNGSVVLIGGEASTLELWDGQKDERIAVLPTQMECVTCSTGATTDWWTIGGGTNTNTRGMVATYHGPTRSLVQETATDAVVQQIHPTAYKSSILSVGQEPWVSHWAAASSLQSCDKVRCESERSFAVACSTTYVAVGGTGSVVDVFVEQHVPYCQLRVPPISSSSL